MISVRIRLLGGLRRDVIAAPETATFPPGSTVADLEAHLKALGFDPESEEIIFSLSGRGLRQWSPERLLEDDEELAVFPHISGG